MKQAKTHPFSAHPKINHFIRRNGLYGTALGSLVAGLMIAGSPALASEGYFVSGYGTQSKGMAGVSFAYPKDSLAIASNPASAMAVGERADVDIDYYRPDRSATISGNAYGPDQTYSGNGLRNFYFPEAGYIHQVNKDLAIGIAVYGNGAMNTVYRQNPYGRFGATGVAGLDFKQFMITPTLATRIAEGQNFGISAVIVDQMFKVTGISIFDAYSESPGSVSDQGTDNAFGLGLHLGWLGEITPWLTLGATWQSKAHTRKLNKYKGLFADQGGFDVPSFYGIGIAVKASPDLDIAFDVKKINYNQVGSVGNDFQRLLDGKLLGSSGGAGFGCSYRTTFKFGVNYKLSPALQLRAGYAYVTSAFPSNQTFLHILAPDVVSHHFTLGTTWTTSGGIEVSAYGRYAPTKTNHGAGSIPIAFGGGEADVSMSEINFGIGVGKRF
jgi:long-chain fatty acid transport protein